MLIIRKIFAHFSLYLWVFFGLTYLNALKDVLKSPWNDTSLGCRLLHPLHGKRLATSSLSIGKNSAIVSLGDTL